MKPHIRKLGTIDCDMAEANPIVFQGKLYRFEYVRADYHANDRENTYFRLVDLETGGVTDDFAYGYHLGCAFVFQHCVYVTAVEAWDGEYLEIFASDDLKRWEQRSLLHLPGWGLFNSSVCQVDSGDFVCMFAVGRPRFECGEPLTARFARAEVLLGRWGLLSRRHLYARNRYTAPHCLRFCDGYYYNFYLEASGGEYQQCVVRSKDLIRWQPSPLNPVLTAGDADRQVANPALTDAQQQRIATAVNISNSAIDFCEYQGKLCINYAWGDQQGTEHLALAEFDGTEAEFLQGWFPAV